MSENLTAEYADKLAARINAMSEAGAPFGYRNDFTDEHADELDDIEGFDADEHDADNLPEGWAPASPLDYLSDVLDFRYVIGHDLGYIGAEVAISLGGPNAWVTTGDHSLTVYWGGAPERRGLASAFIDGLNEAAAELWESAR